MGPFRKLGGIGSGNNTAGRLRKPNSAARRLSTLLQVLGSAGLMIVALAHVCEALHLFPVMGWGSERSPGHYLDLGSAVCGFTLFPLGCLLHALSRAKA